MPTGRVLHPQVVAGTVRVRRRGISMVVVQATDAIATHDVGALLRQARERAGWSQERLAAAVGTSQGAVSAYERGARQPRVDQVARILAALDLQLCWSTEPLWAGVDAAIDRLRALEPAQRFGPQGPDVVWLEGYLVDVPHVVQAETAAVLLGAPVPAERYRIVVRDDSASMAAFAVALDRMRARRWSDAWGEFALAVTDPREPGRPLWHTLYGEIEADYATELPPSVVVACGDRQIPVVAIDHLMSDDGRVARVLQRMRARLACSG